MRTDTIALNHLRLLHFDLSSDTEERQCLEAMASVGERHWPALQAEVCQVLGWLHQHFASLHGPAEEGGAWDADLQSSTERSQTLALVFDPATAQLRPHPQPSALGETVRHTLTLTVSAAPEVAQALAEAFRFGD